MRLQLSHSTPKLSTLTQNSLYVESKRIKSDWINVVNLNLGLNAKPILCKRETINLPAPRARLSQDTTLDHLNLLTHSHYLHFPVWDNNVYINAKCELPFLWEIFFII